MKYSLIRADYDYDTNDINLYCRDENYNKVTKKIHGFEPYGYTSSTNKDALMHNKNIYSIEETHIPFINNEDDQQIIFKTESPRDVGQIRKESPFPVHEADIPFPRRYLIDHNIFCGFEAPDDKRILHPSDLNPTDFVQPPRTSFFDIETDIESDKITISSYYDSQTNKYISIALDPNGKLSKMEKWSKDHIVFIVPTEQKEMELIKKTINKINPDILSAWWISFDIEYLEKKSALLTDSQMNFSQMNTYDLLEPYKKLYNKGSNKLKDVIENEELEVPNYEKYNQRFWKEDLERGIRVNKSHTEALVKLNQKLEIIDTYWNFKAIAGFEDLNPTLYHGSMIDIRLLRKYNKKYILPSKPDKLTKRERKNQIEVEKVGGKVFMPPYGLFFDNAFYDLSRYYPELIIGLNLTFEKVGKGEMGLLPEMTLELIEERLKYDRRLNKLEAGSDEHKRVKHIRNSIKFVLNTIFGYTGYSGARLFRLDIFNKITNMGQNGLIFLGRKAKKDGKELIYGDTDSISVQLPNNSDSKQLVKDKSLVDNLIQNGLPAKRAYTVAHGLEYTHVLNHYLEDFCALHGFNRNLELKLDRYFESILFKKVRRRIEGKWVETGAKKRYVGRVLWEKEPVNYLYIRGFEYVRKDASLETKDIQPEVFKRLLSGDFDGAGEFLRERVNKILDDHKNDNLFPQQIAIPTTLSKKPSEYGGKDKNGNDLTPPEYARGAIYANEWLGEDISASDQVHMLYVKDVPNYPYTDVISYTDPNNVPKGVEIDIDKHIERTIKKPIEKVIDSVDLTWKDVFTPNKTLW